MSSKICENRTVIKLRGFDKSSRQDVEFINKMFRVCESGVLMNYLCPLSQASPKDTWGTAFDIQKTRSDVNMMRGGRLVLDYETHLSPPILAFKKAVTRVGIWERLEIHTIFVNKSLCIAGEWSFSKQQTTAFKTFLRPSSLDAKTLPSELAFYLFEVLQYANNNNDNNTKDC